MGNVNLVKTRAPTMIMSPNGTVHTPTNPTTTIATATPGGVKPATPTDVCKKIKSNRDSLKTRTTPQQQQQPQLDIKTSAKNQKCKSGGGCGGGAAGCGGGGEKKSAAPNRSKRDSKKCSKKPFHQKETQPQQAAGQHAQKSNEIDCGGKGATTIGDGGIVRKIDQCAANKPAAGNSSGKKWKNKNSTAYVAGTKKSPTNLVPECCGATNCAQPQPKLNNKKLDKDHHHHHHQQQQQQQQQQPEQKGGSPHHKLAGSGGGGAGNKNRDQTTNANKSSQNKALKTVRKNDMQIKSTRRKQKSKRKPATNIGDHAITTQPHVQHQHQQQQQQQQHQSKLKSNRENTNSQKRKMKKNRTQNTAAAAAASLDKSILSTRSTGAQPPPAEKTGDSSKSFKIVKVKTKVKIKSFLEKNQPPQPQHIHHQHHHHGKASKINVKHRIVSKDSTGKVSNAIENKQMVKSAIVKQSGLPLSQDDEISKSPIKEDANITNATTANTTTTAAADAVIDEERIMKSLEEDQELLKLQLNLKSITDLEERNDQAPSMTDGKESSNPIYKEEFELLYDRLKDLDKAANTLKDSYCNLINSFLKMNKQQDRAKSLQTLDEKTTTTTTGKVCRMPESKANGDDGNESGIGSNDNNGSKKDENDNSSSNNNKNKETAQDAKTAPIDDAAKCQILMHKSDFSQSEVTIDPRFAISRFLDSDTRDETFRELFAEVSSLGASVARLKAFFDEDGDFMIQEYDNSDYRIDRDTFESVWLKTKMLNTVCTKVTQVFNQHLLNIFRLKSQN